MKNVRSLNNRKLDTHFLTCSPGKYIDIHNDFVYPGASYDYIVLFNENNPFKINGHISKDVKRKLLRIIDELV